MKPKIKMDGFLKAVGIVVAAGGLISAIFGEDDGKKIQALEERVKELESHQ